MQAAPPTWSRVGGVLVSILLATSPLSPTMAYAAASVDKTETVHVQTDAAGAVTQVTVDDLLANDAQAAQIEDRSTLSDISPKDDGQSFAQGTDGNLTWTTGGKQVSYEGSTSQQPPVRVTVSYQLDGAPVEPSKLAGATGHLDIRIDYANELPATHAAGSDQHLVSTPFVCMTIVMLDSDVFRNVTVENGRLVDDSGTLAVIGFAVPGLKESLDLDPDLVDLDLPDHLQISADVTDLALDPIYTIVTPELFTDIDTDDLDLDMGDLDEGSDKLEDAMGRLIDGSSALGTALRQLASGSDQINGGVAEFMAKISALPSGMAQLTEGIKGLSEGISVASSAAGQLAEGASGVSGLAQSSLAGVGQAKADVSTANGKVNELKQALKGIDGTRKAVSEASSAAAKAHEAASDAHEGLSSVSADVEQQKAAVTDNLDQATTELDKLEAITIDGLTEEQQEQLDKANAAIAAAKAATGERIVAAQDGLDSVTVVLPEGLEADVRTLEEAKEKLDESKGKIGDSASALDGADKASEAIGNAQASLDSAHGALEGVAGGSASVSDGASQLASSLDQASVGASQLSAGLGGLSDAAPQMLDGMSALAQGLGQLSTGLKATADGSDQLTDGLSTFDREGIAKLVDSLRDMDDDMGDITDRIDALRDSAQDYDNFSGKAEGQTGTVRFIFKTEQIG